MITCKIITEENYNTKPMITFYPDLHSYLRKLKVNTYEELNKMNNKDICVKLNVLLKDVKLIYQVTEKNSFIFSALSCLKHDSDIVNSIVELQELYQ